MYILGGLVDESIQKVKKGLNRLKLCNTDRIVDTAVKRDYMKAHVMATTPPLPQQRLSFRRARELSVLTARLPIDEHMVKRNNKKNFHSKILAVNQGQSIIDICMMK